MTQKQSLRDMDATMAGIFADAGIADSATYTPAGGGAAVPCTVLVDRDVDTYGESDPQVAVLRTVVTLFLDKVTPSRGGTVTIGAESFKLDAELRRDESRAVWVVA